MTDTVTVRVLREHSGDYGHQAAGATYETSKAHALALAARGLVKIVGEPKAEAKAEEPLANKAEAPVENKAEPAPATKAARPAPRKPKKEAAR
jgi:hypothetical protein